MARATDIAAGSLLLLALAPLAAVTVAPSTLAAEALAPAKTHVVEIRQFKFYPATLTVKAGDTVIFKNLDIAPHTATAKSWDSGNLGRNDSWSFKATAKGSFAYICAYHPAMKGTIIVS